MVKILLSANDIDLELVNFAGQSPIDLALSSGHADIVELIQQFLALPAASGDHSESQIPNLRRSTDMRRLSIDSTRENSGLLRASVDSTKRSLWASDENFDLEGQVKVRHQNPFVNLALVLKEYISNYRILLILGMVIFAGAIALSGKLPSRRKPPTPFVPPDQDEEPQLEQDVLPPRPLSPIPVPVVPDNWAEPEPQLLEEHHYWIALTLYFLLSAIIIAAIAYKYRRVWKLKTVVFISSVIFCAFVLCQSMVLETM